MRCYALTYSTGPFFIGLFGSGTQREKKSLSYPIVPHRQRCVLLILVNRTLDIIAVPAQREFRADRVHEDIEQF
jgi:hypothetical protein